MQEKVRLFAMGEKHQNEASQISGIFKIFKLIKIKIKLSQKGLTTIFPIGQDYIFS